MRMLAWQWPIGLEFFSGWTALGIFATLSLLILWMGIRSLRGLSAVRRWVAIGVRLGVVGLAVLILGGVRRQRVHHDLEVMVVRDVSQSTQLVSRFPGQTLQSSIDQFLMEASDQRHKPPNDRIGVIRFSDEALIDAMPGTRLLLDARSIAQYGSQTDVAGALQLALATFGRDAMKRLVLVWDGNATRGDLDAAVDAAVSQHVPIDVVPLEYDIRHEVMVDRLIAPTWKRQGEDFVIEVVLKSTNAVPVKGKLTVYHQNEPMDLDASTPGVQADRIISVEPGTHVERIKVSGQAGQGEAGGVHQFRARFEADNIAGTTGGSGEVVSGDTLTQNNSATAFTFVRGRGKVLYIDKIAGGGGQMLRHALEREGIQLDSLHSRPDQFPADIITLQNYDAVILANVPRGAEGLNDTQSAMLASYVHDMGGGLVMIGGPDAFGAGGWQGSKLAEVLPVNMDVPARRQIPKGALVMIMHACEFADGNFWGAQCAIKAAEALGDQDEVGVISFNWGGPGGGGSQWDFPLQVRGDGSRVTAAIKKMQMGDMPSFDDSLKVALNGLAGRPGLLQSDARQRHIIIISDGDPAAPSQALIDQCIANRITISTVTVYPHGMGQPPPVMKRMAEQTRGRAYGPIESDPSSLPQIFIKEATIIRRSLILEDPGGIPLKPAPSDSELVKGMDRFPPVTGMVLTGRKDDPRIEMPVVAGKNDDPMLAHWQVGLGRVAVFASDARNLWAASWVRLPMYGKFWAQVVRGVSRPPMSGDLDVQTSLDGQTAHVKVEALNRDASYASFLSITGQVMGPDLKTRDIRLVQTGPGTYEAEFDAPMPGNYVVVLSYRSAEGKGGPGGAGGVLLSGVSVNQSPELRTLRSQDAVLARIAQRTGGRVLARPFDADSADFFRREGLMPTASPMPVWDLLIPVLLGLILVDVAARRIAWEWSAIRRGVVSPIRAFLTPHKVETRQSVDALRKIRGESAVKPPADPAPMPDPGYKFQAKGVEGNLDQVVGGATDRPVEPPAQSARPPASSPAPPSAPGGHTGGLLEAKRRARRKMGDEGKTR